MEEWEFYIYICIDDRERCLMVIHGFSFLVGLLNQQSGLCLFSDCEYMETSLGHPRWAMDGLFWGSKQVIKPLIYRFRDGFKHIYPTW